MAKQQRFYVTRLWIKYNGVIFKAGDLLPECFTARDKFRNIWPSRIGLKEVEVEAVVDNPIIPPSTEPPKIDKPEDEDPKSESENAGESEGEIEAETDTDTDVEVKTEITPEPVPITPSKPAAATKPVAAKPLSANVSNTGKQSGTTTGAPKAVNKPE